MLQWRNSVCVFLVAISPAFLAANDNGAAILQSNGGVLLNRRPAPTSAALFPRDTVETWPTAVARIDLTGSAIDINPETLVEFEGDEIVLEHGRISVNTSRAFKVRVGCVIVTPVNPRWTRYDVTDVDGKMTVAALKSDVNIDSRSANPQQAERLGNAGRISVHEGERRLREEKCGGANVKSARAAAQGSILNSPYTVGAAFGWPERSPALLSAMAMIQSARRALNPRLEFGALLAVSFLVCGPIRRPGTGLSNRSFLIHLRSCRWSNTESRFHPVTHARRVPHRLWPATHSLSVSCVSAAKSQTCTTSRRILTIPNFCHRQSRRLTVDRVVPVN